MFTVEIIEGGYALITGPDDYHAEWLADTHDEADSIAVGLSKPAMVSALASHRLKIETGGIDLPDGLHILTDRESQGQLNSAYNTLSTGLIPDTDWKAANGWQTVNLEQIRPIAKASAAHVRACFRAEREVQTVILSSTSMSEIDAIDIQDNFATAYATAFSEVMAESQPA